MHSTRVCDKGCSCCCAATSSTNVDVNEFLRHLLGTLRDMHHVASSVKSRKRGAAGDD